MSDKALRLYVVGETPAAMKAAKSTHLLIEKHLGDAWTLEIIDVLQRPDLAEADRVSAVPVLVRKSPRPVRRVVGDLSDHERVLLGLEIGPADQGKPASMEPRISRAFADRPG